METPTYEEMVEAFRARTRMDDNARWAVGLVFLLGQQKIARDRSRFLPHCVMAPARINWRAALDEGTWSSTETLMLKAAGRLSGDDVDVDLDKAMERFDNYQASVLDAMLLARHTSKVPERYR